MFGSSVTRVVDLFNKFHAHFPKSPMNCFGSLQRSMPKLGAWIPRFVRVYGGLVRHPAITKYGLTLMLAHETGHRLGGLPRDPAMPGMTWQGQADYWAASVAMPRVWGPRAPGATVRAAREIVKLHRMMESRIRRRRTRPISRLPIFDFALRSTRPGYAKLRARSFRIDFR